MKKLNHLNTKLIGKKIMYHQEIDSTQLEAKRLIGKGEKEGTIILADYQKQGMGTHGRVWSSEKSKNLTFSFFLYPNCPVSYLKNLTVVIAQSMLSTIYQLYGHRLEIKDPNDMMYKGKKIGGILTEVTTNQGIAKNVVIGIGLNVNQIKFPKELEEIASSLKIEFGAEYDTMRILEEFCNQFETEYLKLINCRNM